MKISNVKTFFFIIYLFFHEIIYFYFVFTNLTRIFAQKEKKCAITARTCLQKPIHLLSE
jgi:hypothetical protein